jgi:penicillin-binding protein-related factor A (putative recombinase)
MPLESGLQSRVLKYLNSLDNCIAENVSGNSRQKNRADINACWRGTAVKIELKTRDYDNELSLGQKIYLRRWAKAGAICFAAYSLKDVKAMINSECIYHRENFKGEWYEPKEKT